MPGRIRVFIACSLDGFIAGPDDDLSWLPPPTPGEDHGYGALMADVGALLLGRRTYDVVAAFDAWPFEERPVLVATRRPLEPCAPTVRAVGGTLEAMVAEARAAAAGRDVYLDGGELIRQALDANLVDALTVSIVPVVLGRGVPLFAGVARRHDFEVVDQRISGPLVQLDLVPRADEP